MVGKLMVDHINATARAAVAAAARAADPTTRAILDSIRHIVRALRESSRQAQGQVGLSGAQLFVMQRLAGAPALSLNELADRTLTHQSTVSVVVTRLVRRGLITRTRGTLDGRRVEIALTARGRAALARAPAAAQDRLIAALTLVGPEARRALARHLRRLVGAMALPEQHPPMFFERSPRRRPRKVGDRVRAS
jgi:DNA-binding MarR family transcriptional regulator